MRFSGMAWILLIALVASAYGSNNDTLSSSNSTSQLSERSGRKNYEVYSPQDGYAPVKKSGPNAIEGPGHDDADMESPFQPSDFNQHVPSGYYYKSPKARYGGPPMYKSGTNMEWNVWKGEMPPPPKPEGGMGGGGGDKGGLPPNFEEYFFPEENWKADSWSPEKMAAMMSYMHQMAPPPYKPSIGGFLSGLTKEPIAMLLAAVLPLSLILAAVLPTVMNMMMNGGLPTITTTATGNNAGRSILDEEHIAPILSAVRSLGAKALENPGCLQRVFCHATKGGERPLQRALHQASSLVGDEFLRSFGVKDLFDSMADGNCNRIKCSGLFGTSKKHSKRGKHLE